MSLPPTPQDASLPIGDPEEGFDLRKYWSIIVRRRWLVIPVFLAALIGATAYTLRQPKIYDATVTIIIDLQPPKVLDAQQVGNIIETGAGELAFWSQEYYQTQYKIITSRAVLRRAADRLQLGSNLQFLGLEGVKDSVDREQLRAHSDPVAILQGLVNVEPVKDSRIVRIRVENRNPEMAALLANAVADSYIGENLAVKTSTTQSASEWLEKQLADLEIKLERSGKALFDFKREHDIVATSWEDRQSMVSQRLTAFNEALTKTRVQKAQLQARNETIEALGNAVDRRDDQLEALSPVSSNPIIQALQARYLEIKVECADLQLRYLENHPKLEACETKLELANAALQHQIKTTLAGARSEYLEVSNTEQRLAKLLSDTKNDAFDLNRYEREYVELKRTHDNNQRLYEALLKRLSDTGVTGMLQVSNVRVLDSALVKAAPVRPDLRRNLVFAIALGLVGGVVLAFAAESLDTSIKAQSEIEDKVGLTFLGVIPTIERNDDGTPPDLVVHARPKSPAAECLRAIRTNLVFMSPDKPLRTILVTSSSPQEGKSTAAAALAEVMADGGNRVLLLDADMRRPRIHRIFDVPNISGLSSLVVGEGTIHETVKVTAVPNLWVLPCGPVPPNPAELLHTEAFATLLRELAKSYDRIIIDSPPVGVVSDAVVMSAQVDGTVMVIRAKVTSRDAARQSVRKIQNVNARVLGAVLNDLDLESQKYGQYYYYYRYGYYYGKKRQKAVS